MWPSCTDPHSRLLGSSISRAEEAKLWRPRLVGIPLITNFRFPPCERECVCVCARVASWWHLLGSRRPPCQVFRGETLPSPTWHSNAPLRVREPRRGFLVSSSVWSCILQYHASALHPFHESQPTLSLPNANSQTIADRLIAMQLEMMQSFQRSTSSLLLVRTNKSSFWRNLVKIKTKVNVVAHNELWLEESFQQITNRS